jgi:hypothetical protein
MRELILRSSGDKRKTFHPHQGLPFLVRFHTSSTARFGRKAGLGPSHKMLSKPSLCVFHAFAAQDMVIMLSKPMRLIANRLNQFPGGVI